METINILTTLVGNSLTPCNEISMWQNTLEPYGSTIWKNASITHMEAQYKARVWSSTN